MKVYGKTFWLLAAVLIFVCLAAAGCNGDQSAEDCQGDVTVEHAVVARVTPSPRETLKVNQSYEWLVPPYGIEVTGADGEAVMQIFNAANGLLAKYTIYAADVVNGDVSVDKWNGLSEIAFNAGNILVEDSGSQDICSLSLFAGGVGLTSLGTTYVVTVRPEISQVTVAVLDGAVQVTSLGQTTTLDAKVPEESLVVIENGRIGPLMPVPDPGMLLDQVTSGEDIQMVPPPQDNLTLTMWADERLLPVLQDIALQFEKETGIQVLIEGMPVFDIGAKYLAAFQAGSAPDLLTIQHQQMDELAASGSVMPLNMELDPALLIPGTVQAFSYKGDLFAIPYAYDNLALVTNPEYVAEIPPTWSELRSYAAEIAAGRESFTTFFITADGYHFYPIQSAFGGYIFGTYPDGTFNAQDLGLSSDGSLASATWLEETIAKQDVAWGEEDWALTAFQEQKTAIIMTGPWALERLREMGVPFQIHSFPREVQESQPFLSVYGFLENRNTQSPSVAQTFLKYLTTYEAVLAYSNVLRIPPARWDVLENLEDAELRAFGFAGANGSPIPYIPEMDAVWGPWTDAIQSIMIGYMSGYEAFTNAQEIILKEIGQ